jgi:hypothetical protein
MRYGTPEEFFEDAGIQYLIVVLDPSKELEALNNFGDHQKTSISMT